MNRKKILPILIELTGIAAIGSGIGIELATHADIGWVVVTSGSCMVAIGGVIWGKFINSSNK
ncbi:hypothetical protein B1772_01110 [Dehalococcoides mccartyi]|jgi:hypothetical protein|uniref:hypothetical protein n=1 Tax=Dehalococcoides mccartyi TaxID=61435 RepID=UPI0009A48E57|nr:hypothetical protein [Dehalococcoides mccartyi]AQY72700.1 hypothetical protein B1772_01110 [Dehalococcoides mccartyi]